MGNFARFYAKKVILRLIALLISKKLTPILYSCKNLLSLPVGLKTVTTTQQPPQADLITFSIMQGYNKDKSLSYSPSQVPCLHFVELSRLFKL